MSRRNWGTVVLTGATSGIGEAVARELVDRCATLILHGPQESSSVNPLLTELGGGSAAVHYVSADFADLSSVVAAADRIRSLAREGIDLLINNAGVPGAPERVLSADGFERTLQVNALAPALLTRLLVPALASPSRIVVVGSSAHRVDGFHFDDIDLDRDYTPIAAYARAKLAMVTWARLLAEEEAHTSTTVVALCPGLNDTPLSAVMMGRIGGSPRVGAARVLAAAVADVPSGTYLENDRATRPSEDVDDRDNRRALATLFRSRLAPVAARA